MNLKEENILYAFAGKLVGNKFMKQMVCTTLARFPDEVITEVTNTCWFMSSMDDAYGFTFTGNDLANQHLVFLSDDLFAQNEHQIEHTIAHEIGHVILGHKNSTISKQTKGEVQIQELEAENFVEKYLGK